MWAVKKYKTTKYASVIIKHYVSSSSHNLATEFYPKRDLNLIRILFATLVFQLSPFDQFLLAKSLYIYVALCVFYMSRASKPPFYHII